MAFDDTRTEFFGPRGRSSRGGEKKRARSKRPNRRQIRLLGSPDAEARARAASDLLKQGIDSSAEALLQHIEDEDSEFVLATIARTVLDTRSEPQAGREEAQLRAWALAELSRGRRGAMAPAPVNANRSPAGTASVVSGRIGSVPTAPAPPPPAPAPTPAPAPMPAAPPRPADPAPPPPPAVPVAPVSRPVAPTPPPAPGPARPAFPPPTSPAPPPVRPAPPAPTSRPRPPAVVARPSAPPAPRPAAAPAPAGAPTPPGPAAPPGTWRVVKAYPVDIVVWSSDEDLPPPPPPAVAAARVPAGVAAAPARPPAPPPSRPAPPPATATVVMSPPPTPAKPAPAPVVAAPPQPIRMAWADGIDGADPPPATRARILWHANGRETPAGA